LENSFQATKVLVLSFAITIIMGALLLTLPISTARGSYTNFIDALFTSTSAVCVTGLVVVDTATHFTHFGQAVIIILIQLGGLGIMTFSLFLGLVLGKGPSLWSSQVIRDTFGIYSGHLGGLLLKIIFVALGIEAIGALLMFVHWLFLGFGIGASAWAAVFHSISAFCNAGFGIFSDNMVSYKGDFLINVVIMSLIVLGGLGFVVLLEMPRVLFSNGKNTRFSLHSRTVLMATGLLIFGGMTAIYILEAFGLLKSMDGATGLLAALFQSISARTAGFNTIDIGALRPATLFIIIILMFIGASPGGTGGGIKTTSAAIFLADFLAYLRGRNPELWDRTIPLATVEKTYLIISACVGTVILGTFALLLTDPRFSMMQIAFEVTSAFGTVGLSTGITPALSSTGKIVITLIMFAGRLGPLTLALVFGSRVSRGIFKYPEGTIFVG
jgi:trk system potassium uptake protein